MPEEGQLAKALADDFGRFPPAGGASAAEVALASGQVLGGVGGGGRYPEIRDGGGHAGEKVGAAEVPLVSGQVRGDVVFALCGGTGALSPRPGTGTTGE
eukprot:365195-Chlamydomonas_euryale.AAC.13